MISNSSLHALHLSLLATYLLHSTLAIGFVWLLVQFARRTSYLWQDRLWKLAIVLPIFSAPSQLWLNRGMAIEFSVQAWFPGQPDRASDPLEKQPNPRQTAENAEHMGSHPSTVNYFIALDSLDTHRDPATAGSVTMKLDNRSIAPDQINQVIYAVSYGFGVWYLIALARIALAKLRLVRLVRRSATVEHVQAIACLRELLCRAGKRRRIAFIQSSELAEPAACGWILPTIILPKYCLANLNRKQLYALIAHEMAHLRRHDVFWNELSFILQCLFPFQPMHRLARQRWQIAVECLCDDWAVHRGAGCLDLSECLTRLAQWKLQSRRQNVFTVGATSGCVSHRVERLLTGVCDGLEGQSQFRLRFRCVAAIFFTGLLFLFCPHIKFATGKQHQPTVVTADAAVIQPMLSDPTMIEPSIDSLMEQLFQLREEIHVASQVAAKSPEDRETIPFINSVRDRIESLVVRVSKLESERNPK